jgi:hypothetical protein
MGRVAFILSVLSVSALSARGQFTNTSSVLDASGAISSGGGLTQISAAGQPGGIAESSAGAVVNQAGFLGTFFLKPGLDTDGDGIPDEADQDNDGDALADATEIAGGAFDPATATEVNNPDTDGDRMSDGQESVAGTDPMNLNSQLRIVSITNGAGGPGVAWLARGNSQRTYVVRAATSALMPYGAVIFSNTVAGGNAPWFVVTNSLTDAAVTNARFYAVGVFP